MREPNRPRTGRTLSLLAGWLPALVAVLVYLPALPGDFVFDDTLLLEKGVRLQSFDLERIFWDNYWGSDRVDLNYRPTVLLSYAVNFSLLGRSPTGFLLVNILLNAVAATLAYRLLRALFEDTATSCLAACLFAVLPVHTEAVAGIVGRAELLAAIAVMGGWWLVVRSPPEGQPTSTPAPGGRTTRLRAPGWLLVGGIFLAGLGAKESTLVLVPLLVAGAWLLGRRRPVAEVAACVAALVLYLALRHGALAEERAHQAAGTATFVTLVDNPLWPDFTDAGTRVLNGLRLLGHYAGQTLVPRTLSADWSYRQIEVLGASRTRLWVEIAALLVPLAGALIAAWRLHRPRLALAILVFPVGFAVTSNILLPIGTIYGERLAYLPSLAWPMAVAALICERGRRGRATGRREPPPAAPPASGRRAAGLLLLGLLTAVYGARTMSRAADWSDRARLYEATWRSSPQSTRAQLLGASAAALRASRAESTEEERRHLAEAAKRASRALEILPGNARAKARLAAIRFQEGELASREGQGAEATERYRQADDLYSDALATLRRSRQSEPRFRLRRGEVRMRLGRPAEAVEDLDRYLATLEARGEPPDPLALNFRGVSHGMLASAEAKAGRSDEAERQRRLARGDLDGALALRKDLPELYNNRGFLRFLEKDYDGALADYREGLRLCEEAGAILEPSGESVVKFRQRLASVYRARGEPERAAEEIRLAREAIERARAGAPRVDSR